MLGNDHFKPFPNIAKLLYHNPGIKPMILQILQAYMKTNEYGGS